MSRTYFIKLNLDDMCAELDTLRPDQHAEWLAGFRAGARGKIPQGWDGARLTGAEFGLACFQGAEAFRAAAAEAGRKSAEVRKQTHGTAQPERNSEGRSKVVRSTFERSTELGVERNSELASSQYPVSNIENPETKTQIATAEGSATPPVDGFEEFWKLYAYKKSRKAAEKAWKRLSAEDRQAATAAITAYKASLSDQKYCQHPATYLNGRTWEDDHTPKASGGNTAYGMTCPHPPGSNAALDWWALNAPLEAFR